MTYPDCYKAYNEGDDVGQHVEGIRHESEGMCDVSYAELHEEEARCQHHHRHQTTALRREHRLLGRSHLFVVVLELRKLLFGGKKR